MYVNMIIGFTYGDYVYQWDHKIGKFTPNGSIPIDYPIFISYVPNEAKDIKMHIYYKGGAQ